MANQPETDQLTQSVPQEDIPDKRGTKKTALKELRVKIQEAGQCVNEMHKLLLEVGAVVALLILIGWLIVHSLR